MVRVLFKGKLVQISAMTLIERACFRIGLPSHLSDNATITLVSQVASSKFVLLPVHLFYLLSNLSLAVLKYLNSSHFKTHFEK